MRSFSSLMGWASALLVVTACGDDTGVTGGAISGGGGSGGEPAGGNDTGGSGGLGAGGSGGEGGAGAVNWSPCPVSSDESFGGGAECATIKVPLDWSDPDGPKIDFFVKRLPAVMQPSRGQLWFLNGGPGYSGADYDNFAKAQTIDLYLPDHRGTGRSSRLGCPTYESDESEGGFNLSQAELPGCVDELIATCDGALESVGSVSTLPSGAAPDDNFCADLHIHPNGLHLYGSNRGHNSLAHFAVDPVTGALTAMGHTATDGNWPRNFGIDPAGNLLLVANQQSNEVVAFALEPQTGALSPLATSATGSSPAWVGVVPLPMQ